jgi:outer membrane receptor for Fe3+-dicitrate
MFRLEGVGGTDGLRPVDERNHQASGSPVNIFDKQYFTRSSDNNSGMYVGAPRTFFVQASVGY